MRAPTLEDLGKGLAHRLACRFQCIVFAGEQELSEIVFGAPGLGDLLAVLGLQDAVIDLRGAAEPAHRGIGIPLQAVQLHLRGKLRILGVVLGPRYLI
ncbi:MAG: hypothetical protein IPH43_00210 [Xanthomonadales bacterium]|nr:hypothetical protein [Xanthomonadales bacterium]